MTKNSITHTSWKHETGQTVTCHFSHVSDALLMEGDIVIRHICTFMCYLSIKFRITSIRYIMKRIGSREITF